MKTLKLFKVHYHLIKVTSDINILLHLLKTKCFRKRNLCSIRTFLGPKVTAFNHQPTFCEFDSFSLCTCVGCVFHRFKCFNGLHSTLCTHAALMYGAIRTSHYSDVTMSMSVMVSQITVNSTVCSIWDDYEVIMTQTPLERNGASNKHRWTIHRTSMKQWALTGGFPSQRASNTEIVPFDDVIMNMWMQVLYMYVNSIDMNIICTLPFISSWISSVRFRI